MVSHNKDSTKSILGETLVWKSFIKILKRDVAIRRACRKNRGDGHWHPCRSWRRSWVLPSMIFGGKKNQKVGMMKLGMTHLRILFFLHDHAFGERTPSSNNNEHADSKQSFDSLLQISQHLGQLCSSLGTSETSRFARLQDDWKLTPIDYARTSGKTNPKSQRSTRWWVTELLRRLKMVTTRRWQRYNDT